MTLNDGDYFGELALLVNKYLIKGKETKRCRCYFSHRFIYFRIRQGFFW